MPASFHVRGIEENEWRPNVAGVDFTERMHRKMGEWALEAEIYTIWVEFSDDDYGEGYEMQITPDNCRMFTSELDDDSDTVSIQDRRDSNWFVYLRSILGSEPFDQVANVIRPWARQSHGLTPQQDVYQKYLDQVTTELGDEDLHVPEDW